MEDHGNRRRSERIEVQWPVSVETASGPIEGETVNISEGGVAICCDEGLPLDEVMKMSIMPPDYRIIEVSGQVSWSDLCGIDDQNKAVGLGVCFMEIAESDRQYFVEFIRQHTGSKTPES
ncbi:MAG: PilZ domain-containing protein [Desulfobacterales bacterium]|nr:PilZ domain-containing protein [Desulfobacterales bacterium]